MASGFLDVLRIVEGYTLEVLVDKIKTPILVLDDPDGQFSKGQPRELFERLECGKEFVKISVHEGAGSHCHQGSGARLIAAIFHWLLWESGYFSGSKSLVGL